MQIELSEKNERLKTVEMNNKELQKNEADLFKCLEDKAVLEIIENEKNSTEKVSREELLGNVTSLTRELEELREKMREMNMTRAELGRTIVGLRARVESYSQWDRNMAEKAYSDNTAVEEPAGSECCKEGAGVGRAEGPKGAVQWQQNRFRPYRI